MKKLCLMALIILAADASRGQGVVSVVRELLQGPPEQVPDNQITKDIRREPALLNFYTRNHFDLAWEDGEDANELLFEIRGASLDGLEPNDYYLDSLSELVRRELGDYDKAILDITLTSSFLKISKELHEGKTNPATLHPGSWDPCIEPLDYVQLLHDALDGMGVYLTLESIKPQDRAYGRLKRALSEMREITSRGGLAEVQAGTAICPGDADERIAAIRTRLAQLNMLPAELDDQTTVYDTGLLGPITLFQELHGLRADGVIGEQTQLALSRTADQYIEMILINLERFRWHQSHLSKRSIMINIPAFELEVADGDEVYLRTRAIVGRADRKTPVLSSAVTMIIVNPTWTIPPTVLKEDVLPAVKADVGYLRAHNIRLFNSRGIEIPPDSLPWRSYSADNFPFTMREDPGPRNPLGLIKFFFPNGHTVYLHDTNVHSLFKEKQRAFSSGCIRIELPMALARMLFEGTEITEQVLREMIEAGETRYIPLKVPVPIHLVYFTLTATEGGQLMIAPDIYGYDPIVLEALRSN